MKKCRGTAWTEGVIAKTNRQDLADWRKFVGKILPKYPAFLFKTPFFQPFKDGTSFEDAFQRDHSQRGVLD